MGGEGTTTQGGAVPTPEELERLAAAAESAIAAVADRAGWESLRVEWAGARQGRLRDLQALIRLAPDKRAFGQAFNQLKSRVEAALARRDEELADGERAARLAAAREDVTLPGRRPATGSLHPVTHVARQIEEIFRGLGYSVAEGPEVEDDRTNFALLNFPDDHPARDAQDTLMLADGRLLRTHTSPVQIRTMLARQPPIRVICPGRVFRNDNDLRHSPMFHQVEGLCVAEGITVGDLKGTLLAFVQRLFAADTRIRLRPSFFPFTEPSCEVDISCQLCGGSGCPTCSLTGWMEILGAGMVDPRVLANCGIDPDRYSGFAFGLGLDRVAMNNWGIPNIRSLFESDERLLRQVRG
ncbi:MAG: phenylalanine--tRNA ligase subunit alpha [Thermoanaerobaculia bacterium]|nr:MAG: phenylalanine--tRNA ligase subunit alpha [Thermoanaerobaculia bacterium]MBZ0101121.1 phenylalanine--tRNA ligase subunit alpha [Thermoanaerobaculia bacterium]